MPPPTSRPAWFALRLRSRFEFAVEAALAEQGFERYLPTRKELTRWSDRSKTIIRPLFTGYIFSRFDRSDPRETARVLQCRGVVQILGQNESIPDDQIARLRRIAESPLPVAECPYVAGDTVTVMSGPMAGTSGIVRRTRGADQLVVAIEILGRAVGVQLEAGTVTKSAE